MNVIFKHLQASMHESDTGPCNDELFSIDYIDINPFTAEVAIMRLLGSAPKSHLCDHRSSKVTGLSDLMTLFIDLRCLYCKHTQRASNVFKNTLNWLKIDSIDQKFNRLESGNFSQDAGTPGTGWESHCVLTADGERVKPTSGALAAD
jgi:hypothetical protein